MKELHTGHQQGLCFPASGTSLTCSVKDLSSCSADLGREFGPQFFREPVKAEVSFSMCL